MTTSPAPVSQSQTTWVGRVGRDLRYALRGIAARPFAATIIIATLALGIGANTAIFSIVDRALVHPLPVRWLDQLVVVQNDFTGINLHHAQVSPGEALDLFKRADLFQSATAFSGANVDLTGHGNPRRLAAVETLGDFFNVFGLKPYLGRFYRPEDSENGNDHDVVLSYATWRDVVGGDPHAIGSRLELNDQSYEVIGVLPPDFRYPRSGEIWMPFHVSSAILTPDHRGDLYFTSVARLRAGLTASQLSQALHTEAQRWHDQYGQDGYSPQVGQTLVAQSFVLYLSGELRPILLVLVGAVLAVLLIACANVASLQLVRGARRARDLTIRTALGAERARLVQQLLVENAALATFGGVVGLAVAVGLVRMIARSNAPQFAALRGASLDPATLGFTAATTALAAILFGVLPALRTTRLDASRALKEMSGRGLSAAPGRVGVLHAAVVAQFALAFVLLLASGLMIRSLANLLESDPGFRARGVVTAELSLHGSRYPTPVSRLAFQEDLLQRLRGMPGVQSASTAFGLPFTDLGTSSSFHVIGHPLAHGSEPHADMFYVESDYFQTLGIRLLEGRAFARTDGAGAAPVVIIDEALAKQYFPGENPIGREIDQGSTSTVIGVVSSVKSHELGSPEKATVYYYMPQAVSRINVFSVAVRSTLPESDVAAVLRSAVRELDPNVPLFAEGSLQEGVSRSVGSRQIAMDVMSAFAALALLLATLGIYGVLSYSVSQRRREIGIRLALGARREDVVRLIMREGSLLVLIGLAIGSVGFIAAGRIISAILYGVTIHDTSTMIIGVMVLVGAALGANWLPAWRAGRLDPIETLRVD